jgi:hypothetical protein
MSESIIRASSTILAAEKATSSDIAFAYISCDDLNLLFSL